MPAVWHPFAFTARQPVRFPHSAITCIFAPHGKSMPSLYPSVKKPGVRLTEYRLTKAAAF
jgi:hypothetical protein